MALAGDPASQLHLKYRGADAAANPYLALGALLRAGLDGVAASRTLPSHPLAALAQSRRSDALRALAENDTVRGWLSATLYEAYTGVKQSELDAVAELDLGEVCKRYAAIY